MRTTPLNRMIALALAAVLLGAASHAATAAAATSTSSLKRQVRALKRANDKLAVDNEILRSRRAVACALVGQGPLCNPITVIRNQLTDIAALREENTALRGDIPARVGAVAQAGNISDLFNLVILPARRAWACGGSSFYGSTFWSVDFSRQGYCD